MCTLLKQTSIHICIETTVKILILVIIYDFELLLATVICFSLIFWKVQLISIKWESQNHISELEFRSHWRPYAPTPILWIVKMVIIHHESEWVCAGIKDFKSQPPFITLSERGWTKHFAYVKKKKSSEFCSRSHHADFTVKIDKENHVLSQMGGLVPILLKETSVLSAYILFFLLFIFIHISYMFKKHYILLIEELQITG